MNREKSFQMIWTLRFCLSIILLLGITESLSGQITVSGELTPGKLVTYTLATGCDVVDWSISGPSHIVVSSSNSSRSIVWYGYGTATITAIEYCGTARKSTVTSQIQLPPLPAPTGFAQVWATCNLMVVKWDPINDAQGFYVDVAYDSGFSNYVPGYNSLNVGKVVTYSIASGLTSGTTYYVRVRAYDSNGAGPYSNTLKCNTSSLSNPGVITRTSVSESQIGISWSPNSQADEYFLDVSVNSSFSGLLSGYNNLSVGNASSRTISGLSPGTTYYFRIRYSTVSGGPNGSCLSNYSNTSQYTTTPSAPAAATTSYANGQTTMTRPTPPSGHTYYWQSSSTGTSTSNSSTTMVFTSNGNYYLRSRHNVSGLWSSAKSGSVTIYTTPSAPGAATASYASGQTTMTRPTPPSGYTYYWQSSSTGTSTSNSATTMVFTSSGTYYLRSRHNVSGLWSSSKSGSVTIYATPSAPGAATASYSNGQTTMTRPTPPSGYTYYWQSSSTGTSTSNSSSTMVFTTNGTYYLRSRHNVSGLWSSAKSGSVTIYTTPSAPGAATASYASGQTTMTRPTPPSGHTYYWQSSSTGTSTSNSSTTMVFTSNGNYYLRSRHNVSGLWSSAKSGSVTIYTTPSAPGAATASCASGQTTMTRPTPPSGYTYYWQSSSTGTSTSNSSTTMVFTSNGNYYLRSRHNVSGLWSSAKSGSVTIYTTPSAPGAATASYANGQTTMTRPTPPSGHTYYWQSSSTGTSTSNSSTTMVFTSNGTYYLRSRHNVSGLWSSSKSGSVTIYTTPSAPGSATASYANGQTTMTCPTPPSGHTYYWQSSSTGTSTSNSSTTIVFTSNGTYYLRSRHNVSGLWSSSKSGIISVYNRPSKPETPVIELKDTGTYVTMPASPTGVSYYWQAAADGTSVIDSQIEKVFASATTIYLRPRNDAPSYLWGEALKVDIPILPTEVSYSNENYISSIVIKKEGVTDTSEIDVLKRKYKSVQIKYMDGLGRPMQVVDVWSSPKGHDLIHQVYYDSFGRERFKYLPITKMSNDGSYNHVAKSEIIDFYTESHPSHPDHVASSTAPYAETVFESSPLSRVLQQGAPGETWQPGNPDTDHTVRYSYETNGSGEVPLLYVGDDMLKHGKIIDGYYQWTYPSNELYKTVVKDENWTSDEGKLHTTVEYRDKSGNVILKRSFYKKLVYTNTWDYIPIDTYYVYDDFGLLRYVLPPEASKLLSAGTQTYDRNHPTIIKPWSYYYKYDGRKRMIEKQLPGADPIYMVYDNRDRLVLTQDGEQRKTNQWLFTKYDQLNRPVMTGLLTTSLEHSELCKSFGGFTGQMFETSTESGDIRYSLNSSYPNLSGLTINEGSLLTVNYYDNYSFLASGTFSGFGFDSSKGISGYSDSNDNTNYFDRVKGLVTGVKVKVLDGLEHTSNATWIASVNYYDDRYRVIQTVRHLYPRASGNKEWISNKYNFVGEILSTRIDQSFQGISKKVVLSNEYDHAGRLLSITHGIDNASPVPLVTMSYNGLGQVSSKVFHGDKQYVDYAYNIRGWLTQINDPATSTTAARQFAMKLYYESIPSGVASNSQFNGNISAMEWRSRDLTTSTNSGKLQGYGYSYDEHNRIVNADYGEGISVASTTLTNSEKFDVSIGSYDFNGNIQGLSRRAEDGSMLDNLTYYYGNAGNQLQAVTDIGNKNLGFVEKSSITTGEYSYDTNGNMTKDLNKGISNIVYNHLNLPRKVLAGSQSIDYIYSADGAKHAKISPDGATTYYAGGFVYKKDAGSTSSYLDYIQHNEGLVQYTGTNSSSYEYQYYLKDHLGNTRVVINQNGDKIQQSDYYPFGMAFNKGGSSDNPYLYNGKEIQEDILAGNPLDWYDYGARFYDPSLGRFMSLDPLSETYFHLSTYNYCANNPILFIDPDGQKIVIGNNTSGALTNLAKIAATSQGRQRLNRLINSPYTYSMKSTFWSSSSAYDGAGEIGPARTVYYVGSAWRTSVDGGAMSSMYAMGHEINHAYDHDRGYGRMDTRKSLETQSVYFTNYLRSAHGDGDDMRTKYWGLGLNFSDKEGVYNHQNEKVTDFEQTMEVSVDGSDIMGFSYNTSKNGEEATTNYVISLKTKKGVYAYRVFTSKEEYDAAVERVNNLKKKEDEEKDK